MNNKKKYYPVILFISILAALIMPLLPPLSPAFAESSHTWTTKADFDAGVLNQVDTSSSPGDVILATDVDTGSGTYADLEISDTSYTDYRRGAITHLSLFGTNIVYIETPPDRFYAGDELLIIQMEGSGAGTWETAFIQSVGSGQIVLTSNLVHNYYADAINKAQVIMIPQYTHVTVKNGGILTCHAWDGGTGGIVFFRATDNVTVEQGGRIWVSGAGYIGGHGGSGGSGGQGGDGGDPGQNYQDASAGGVGGTGGTGGAGGCRQTCGRGGHGARYGYDGNQGSAGDTGDGPAGGASNKGGTNGSTQSFSLLELGSGGGGGYGGWGGYGGGGTGGGGGGDFARGWDGDSGTQGGTGGEGGFGGTGAGAIMIFAKNINVQGWISAEGGGGFSGDNGGNGDAADNSDPDSGAGGQGSLVCGGGGGGGGNGTEGGFGGHGGSGGAGGTIWLAANNISLGDSLVTALGGDGGDGGEGGDGGSYMYGGAGGSTLGWCSGNDGNDGSNGPPGTYGGTGASGGSGKIRLDYATFSGTTNPSPGYVSGTYSSSGTIACDVLDNGIADTPWQELEWQETINGGTNISFEVRASNTIFDKNDATPAWISVGDTSPVTAGLPSGRYMQWRAILTTSNTFDTPELHQVTVNYTNAPVVQTERATSITETSAILNGNLIDLDPAPDVMVSFEWGVTSGSYDNETTPQQMSSPGVFQAELTGLIDYSTYYYRAKATADDWGTSYGEEKKFTTKSPPVISTSAADSITTSSANLNGAVNIMPYGDDFMSVFFTWGTDPSNLNKQTEQQYLDTEGYFNKEIHGLAANTTYYFQANGEGYYNYDYYWGDILSFTTKGTPPSVSTGDATSIAANTATLNGTLANLGSADTVNVSFEYGTTQGGPYPNTTTPQAMTDRGSFNANLNNLTAATTYYYRATGDGGAAGTGDGNEVSFTTSSTPPAINTSGATGITADSGTLNGTLANLGTADTVNVSFQYGTEQDNLNMSTPPQALTAPMSFQSTLDNLDADTTYYFRARGDGGTSGTSYGTTMSFTTNKIPPSVSTNEASAVTADSATLNGTLHSLGTAATVDVSFQWGTTKGMYSNETTPQTLSAPADFSANLSGLSSDTTYYYRAKANGGIHGTSYGDEEVFTTNNIPPSVTTGNATDLTTNSAVLTGNLDALGTAAKVDVSFRYGTTQGGPYPNSTTEQSMTVTGAFQIGVDGLTPKTTYYFIARADGGTHGIDYGAESSFSTGMYPPFVVTDPATDPTDTEANLNGTLYSLGSANTVNAYFEYGTTQGGPYPDTTTPQAMATTGTFQQGINGLTPATTYYFRSLADGGQYGTTTGDEMSFTTSALPPIVATNDASDILSDSATLNGNLDNLGDAATVNVSFEYGTTQGGPYFDSTTPQAMTSTGAFQAGITGLHGDTTYYFRARGDGGIYGSSYGVERSFTTAKIPPVVATENASKVVPNSATLNGFLDSMGTAPTVDVSFEYGTTEGGPYPNTTPVQTLSSRGYFHADIDGLSPLTNYYFRALADGGAHGSDTGDEFSFGTGATPPSVSTGGATAVTADSATLNGDLHALGTSDNVNVAFQWGTSSGVYSHQTASQTLSAPADFSANLSVLDSDNTYYYRAMADGGENGTSFGSEHSFTTNALPPTVTTDAATDMTTDSAFLNGTLDTLGTSATVNVSFLYGTTPGGPYPDVTTPQAMTATGAFQTPVTGLSPDTTYYFKAKADGGAFGTAYGAELNFTTDYLPPLVETSHASDIITNAAVLNGNLYNLGSAATVDVSFEYGTTQGGPYPDTTTPQAMTTAGPFLAGINGLTPETTYYFRAVADGGAYGTSYGQEQMFTTSFFPPEVITDNANNITASSATLNGDLRFLGSAAEANVSFMYGTTQGGPYPFVTTPQAMTATGVFNASIAGLSANTAYYFKAKGDGGIYGNSYGQEMSFVTSAIPPTVTTGNADDITGAGAQLNGNLANLGSAPLAYVSFQWGTASGTYTNETTPQLMTGTGDFLAAITGLNFNQQYYYRAKAAGDGTGYGAEQSFWTSGGKDGVETATGKGMAYFSSNAGTFQNLRAVSDTTLPAAGRPVGMSFIYGLFSFDIVDITPGSTVTITIMLPGNVPTGTQYWDFINGQWVNLTSLMGHNDGDNILTLTITDGGLGDADGQVNGRISEPGGPSNYYAGASTSNRLSSSSSSTPERTITMPANLSVKYLNVQPQRAQANQKVVVYANITNSGDETTGYVAELRINGQVEQLKTGNVSGHAAVPLQFEVMKDRSGTYTVDINGQQAYFTVSGESNGVDTSRKVLQIALILSAIAILSLAVLLIRRIKAD